MPHRHARDHEDVPRAVVGLGNDFPASFEVAPHRHRRGQLLYAASGVVAVSTPEGAWVAPPERAVWIPAGTQHAVRMVGAVQTRSALIWPSACPSLGQGCRVIAVSPLLRQLLITAADLPLEYDEQGRDGLVMRLLVAEIVQAPIIPLVVPFPTHSALAERCHAFLEHPDAGDMIDRWADAMAMNRRSFTRLFRRETGMSFAEWRQQACLSVALPRLAAGEPVTSIALDLGYDSPASFSTMFKRVLGVTPSRYHP
jgi:AraC-like DNA-binding protein/mannose-6-phosphate isomerase-like protein (cupin superfamily)